MIFRSFWEVNKGDFETRELPTRGLSVNSIPNSLSLKFLVYFAEMSNYCSMKTNKRKVRKSLKCVKEYLRRFDLKNGKYLSVFLGVLVVTHSTLDITVHKIS